MSLIMSLSLYVSIQGLLILDEPFLASLSGLSI